MGKSIHELAQNALSFFLPLFLIIQFCSYFGRYYWVLDIFAHAQGQFFLAAAIFFLLSAVFRLPGFVLVSVLSLGLSSAALWPLYRSVENVSGPQAEKIRLVSLNVLTSNSHFEEAGNYLKGSQADLILLLEVDERWIKGIEPAVVSYPYRFVHPRADNFGLALYSKFPLEDAHLRTFGSSPTPVIDAQIRFPGKTFRFYGIHTLPPLNLRFAGFRNAVVQGVFDEAKQTNLPVVVAGDLNTSRWGALMRGLLTENVLFDTGEGFGFQPTWFGRDGIFGIPIDMVLTSKHFHTLSHTIGPDIGSDHRGVEVIFAPKVEPAKSS